ncbi:MULTISPECIES: spore germination protein [Bacillus]|uniref:spore germination protein n=1 Tax=Bacillus TaxID=1386 RepID=UPI0002FEA71A|nr:MULTISPECIES: spore germination protein [Bacillus]
MLSFFSKKHRKQKQNNQTKQKTPVIDEVHLTISLDLEENIESIKKALGNSDDILVRDLHIQNKKAKLIYLYSLADNVTIQSVLDDLLSSNYSIEESSNFNLVKIKSEDDQKTIITNLLTGFVLLFLEGQKEPYSFMALRSDGRQVTIPTTENVVRGSHEGYVESLQTNLFLIRKGVVSPNLTIKQLKVGKEAEKTAAIVYLNNVADLDLVNKIEERIKSIDVDSVFSLSVLEAYIEEYSITPFSQTLTTERIDRSAGGLLEGRIVLLLDGNPCASILPISFISFFQSPDDYNLRFLVASFNRIIRFTSFFTAILLPAFYIAIVGFHYEVVPQRIIFTVQKSVESIPYGPLVEAGIVEVFIELIREATLRLPTKIGPTIGIVGGLVIGDAIVKAGLVSNIMVVVVALTAISSFVIPSSEMSATVRILRFPFMFLASILGIYGIVIGIVLLVGHLCKLRPFGVPYLTPFTPLKWKDLKDTIIRAPIFTLNTRPTDSLARNTVRERFSRWWKKR